MSFIAVVTHVFIDILCGLLVLQTLKINGLSLSQLAKALAIGMLVETLFIAGASMLGMSILWAFLLFAMSSILVFILSYKKLNLTWKEGLTKGRITIWEGFLLFFITEKLIWALYTLIKLPVYFDNALNHWSGRGKALLYDINWSWSSDSPYFMGKAFGSEEFPLFASIWRATNSALNGSPTGFIERIDGVILWLIVIICTASWIFEESGKRWLGIAGAAILCAIPLEAWHMTAGYTDIYVQAYLILALWSIFKKEYIVAGIMSAAMIWSNNEGLIPYLPALIFLKILHLSLIEKDESMTKRLQNFFKFNLTWILIIGPWFLFKFMKGIGTSISATTEFGYVEGSISKMAQSLFSTPSSGILWLFVFGTIVITLPRILRNQKLFSIAIGAAILMLSLVVVYTSTGAYPSLENQSSIHRSLLQIAPLFVVLVCLSLVGDKTTMEVQEENN